MCSKSAGFRPGSSTMMSVPFLMMVGLGDAELVDAAADGLDALAERVIAHLLDLIRVEAQPNDARRGVALDQVQRLAVVAQEGVVELGLLGGLREGQDDVVAPLARDRRRR